MIRYAASIASLALLAACATAVETETVDEVVDLSGGRECPAAQFQLLVGQLRGEIDTSTLPVPHRIYGRGDAVTMDYRSDRMNIVIGEDNRVEQVTCG
ncbi:MAG: I78 family peptidase inhibitor [Caulobacterales bacterium]|uniref:I78 family peptidase inhibitor n=1 Tax=Glycocaulis sp. TaxID=1969725 RepID=UPI003FA06E43